MPTTTGKRSVYVSSTYVDLKEHRAALKIALEKAGFDVECMEKYPAFEERPQDYCLADVAAADVYVLLIAHRYGYRPPEDNPENRSITHLEYEEAGRHPGKPRLAFTVDQDHPWPPRQMDDGEDKRDLTAFRKVVEQRHGVGRFTTADKLSTLVLQALQRLDLRLSTETGQRSYTAQDPQVCAARDSEAEMARVFDLYCQKASTAWDIIDLSQLPEGDVHMATQKLLLRSLYMPLRVRFGRTNRVSDKDGQLKRFEVDRDLTRRLAAGQIDHLDSSDIGAMEAPMSVGERLATSKHLVVLGDPGGGKTTMLRWLATTYLLRHLGDPVADQIPDVETLPAQPWFPVLIRCRDIGAEDLCRSFSDVLTIQLRKTGLRRDEARIMDAIIDERIAKGEILLLIDGLDEITDRTVRMMFCEELERVAARYPETPILVTSRIVGYREMPYRMGKGFDHGVISDLQAEDKEHFAKRWVEVTESHQTEEERTKSGLELIEALRSTDRIKRLTGNPMMLTTMALVKRQVGKLPTKRSKLYAQAVNVLLNWNQRVYEQIDADEALPQLEYLAYEMCRRGVQRLSSKEVLDLLHQIRKDYPDIWPIHERKPQIFLNKIEERSGLLMRSGDIWQPSQRQEKAVWEFRHLTFQEYLAARALISGFYPASQEQGQSLTDQVAHLATPLQNNGRKDARSTTGQANVPDAWREALRLLVADCRHQDVNGVLLSILHPTAKEDPAISHLPRTVLAAQCLAEEPYVRPEIAKEVLDQFVSLVGSNEGVADINTTVERTALEVWQSTWKAMLQTSLIRGFCEGNPLTRANCGGVLAQLLGQALETREVSPETITSQLLVNLGSTNRAEAISAALTVVQLAYQGRLHCSDDLVKGLFSLLERSGAEASAAIWALGWLCVNPPSDPEQRAAIFNDRLAPPVLASCWEGASECGWHPSEWQTSQLLEALKQPIAEEGGGKRHLLRLLGKSVQPRVALPLLGCVADPDASVREAARDALGWLANHLPAPLPPDHLDALEDAIGAQLVKNGSLPEVERCDGLVVVALFGRECLLWEVLDDQDAPVALRRRAAEALGLVAFRCGDGDQRRRLRQELEPWLRSDALDLLVEDEEDWAEHDRLLPLLQGASRGLQLAATADFPRLGEHTAVEVPMLTLTARQDGQDGQGVRIGTEVVERAVWHLPLPAGEQLELVVVPAGEYWIGSPEEEEGRELYRHLLEARTNVNVEARRLVRLESFALSRHLITQAQWQAVALLPRLERDLNPTPGSYKPDDLWERFAQRGGLPVESVSWLDCQEWLRRLNRWLLELWSALEGQGDPPQLALPGEGQWEVACRAGESTPFHFGDTLDASWANYDGNYTYGPGRKGAFRRRPSLVGAHGLVNRWGLAEMHGQLLEWCGDQWHPNPIGEGWPSDGLPWEGLDPALEAQGTAQKNWKLLRGGSWLDYPLYCRAAVRLSLLPAIIGTFVGLRPCCLLPPGSLLGS
jgi:formylglycine-generating enzyme required for sulfatase activity